MGLSCSSCSDAGCGSPHPPEGGRWGNHADYVVALAGNPNTGKSTVFNALTGLKQRTGNWPGKTVMRAEGMVVHAGRRFKLVDLPGTYSLLSTSQEEEIARNFILFDEPHATVVVVDATCLERNLNLVLQILEITDRAVVCLNLMDEAARKGIRVDEASLERDLGIPVVPTVARSGTGLGRLMDVVSGLVAGEIATSPHRLALDARLRRAVEELRPLIERMAPCLPNIQWVALRLLDGDERVTEALWSGELARQAGALSPADRLPVAPVQEAFA
ncbi:MAG: FeoB small GTPase domain-containing protein [Nitrospinota bacterium]